MFQTTFVSPFSSFNDEKIKLQQCQLKLFQEKLCHKKFYKGLKKELNSTQSSMQHRVSVIDFAHVSSLFLCEVTTEF